MRSPVTTVFLVLLIAPAAAGAQDMPEPAPVQASSASAPAPVDAQARAPAKSRSIFGQAMAELTRSVEDTRTASNQAAAPATPTPSANPPRDHQVAREPAH